MVKKGSINTDGHKVARRINPQESQSQPRNEGDSFTVGAVEIQNIVELFKKLGL